MISLRKAFTPASPYKNVARFAAILWTLLLFALCFMPGKEVPRVNIPFIDKWAHFVLFGTFAILWLCAYPSRRMSRLLIVFVAGIALGWLVEFVQGQLPALGRSQDNMDALADAVGALLGVLLFAVIARRAEKRQSTLL